MAAGSLLALIDDIASVLDDVALMSKVAARKTAGVLGDDLALNAQQVTGIAAERELPVVWAVALGSLRNKAILVPAALAISAFLPQAITPLLMLGGAYLCFEGFEKVAHNYLHSAAEDAVHEDELADAPAGEPGALGADMRTIERDKIKGAVRTDFILSAEIIVITLGVVSEAGASFGAQVAAMVAVAIAMTIGVYGIVAAIVKIDDAGLYLSRRDGVLARAVGGLLLAAAPRLMKALSVIGTVAMFMVGGGIIGHAFGPLHHLAEGAAAAVAGTPLLGGLLKTVVPAVIDALAGVVVGAVVLLGVSAVARLRRR
jgi:predicted DNA repair protein MutK